MARISWVFIDPETYEEYNLPVNPNTDSGSHAITKQVDYSVKAGSFQDGLGQDHIATVIYSKGADLQSMAYEGFAYNETELSNLELWFTKKYPIEIQDDLGRRWLIMVENFTKSRVRSNQNRFKHAWTMSAIVLERIS